MPACKKWTIAKWTRIGFFLRNSKRCCLNLHDRLRQLPTGRRLLCLGTRWQMAVSRSSAQKAEKSCSCRSSVISHLSTLRCCGDSCLTIRCQPRSDGVRGPHLPEQTKIWWCCKCLLQVVSSRNL